MLKPWRLALSHKEGSGNGVVAQTSNPVLGPQIHNLSPGLTWFFAWSRSHMLRVLSVISFSGFSSQRFGHGSGLHVQRLVLCFGVQNLTWDLFTVQV